MSTPPGASQIVAASTTTDIWQAYLAAFDRSRTISWPASKPGTACSADFAAFMRKEAEKWGEVIRISGRRRSSGWDATAMPELTIQQINSSDYGPCPCCGDMSRSVWGLVYENDVSRGSYFVHWTLNQVENHGAHIDLIIGTWRNGKPAGPRSAISLEYRIGDTGPSVMVIDAHGRHHANVAERILRREDVIGTPLAKKVFAICDAVLLQDERLTEIPWGQPRQ